MNVNPLEQKVFTLFQRIRQEGVNIATEVNRTELPLYLGLALDYFPHQEIRLLSTTTPKTAYLVIHQLDNVKTYKR